MGGVGTVISAGSNHQSVLFAEPMLTPFISVPTMGIENVLVILVRVGP